jgi:hypothetical protein
VQPAEYLPCPPGESASFIAREVRPRFAASLTHIKTMQEELFFAPEGAQLLAPPKFAELLLACGIPVRAETKDADWRLLFEGAIGTYADLTTNIKGEAIHASVHIGTLRDIDDFRRLVAAFQQLGWTYCGSTYYQAQEFDT